MTTPPRSVGSVAKWNAWSHSLIGQVTMIDSLLTYLLGPELPKLSPAARCGSLGGAEVGRRAGS